MECKTSDSKKLFKVFDASKRKRTRKKRIDDSNSLGTNESTGVGQGNGRRTSSAKASLQDLPPAADGDGLQDGINRERGSSPSLNRSPVDMQRSPRSPRRNRRTAHRHSRRHEECRPNQNRETSVTKDCQKNHRKHRDEHREREKVTTKEERPMVDQQAALFETFAKFCVQMNEKTVPKQNAPQVPRSHSHKSLQCEVEQPVRLRSRERSRDRHSPSKIRSYENFRDRLHSRENIPVPPDDRKERYMCGPYDKPQPRYASKVNVMRNHEDERYRELPPERTATRSCVNSKYYGPNEPDRRIERDYDDRRDPRKYEDRRRICEQKTSRSFDMRREGYVEDDSYYRRTARSDGMKDKIVDDRDYRDRRCYDRSNRDKYFDDKERQRNFSNLPSKDHRSRRNLDRLDRMSIVSRDDDYKDRERYSERERDSGLSVADGETSTLSERSNCLRVVKQEISEQREAMDKMMKLWKELMRCFKDISQNPSRDKSANETANNVRESAVEQLRLWRECMRRYETVARDVGDTDARLMEEINKQRSEMSEMANMWQECLQRYRDMSNDFNNLKQQLATSESPARPAAAPPTCVEGEGPLAAPYRMPHHYPQMLQMPPVYGNQSSPLRGRASAPPAPPAWWWGGEPAHSPRRRSSPDSHVSRERRHRHKTRERDDSRYKEKSKSNGTRSDHRHRKR
ncbi:uncharacterized protein DDB_G0283697 isoform X2 [Bicyclus anynana]|uniref:Uncharacterized protein DDB_G0283697 isoform X2 n=1 Tax=Bicyclus anynana TaxID=110368 RepID=A0ABM3LZF6_BICAN|nr:uncharacterized protein DDB_G0283697 isoform X2 [Bicyclus anynana]